MKKFNWKQRILIALPGGITYWVLIVLMNGGFSPENIREGAYGALFLAVFFGLGFPYLMEKLAPKLASKVVVPQLKEMESIVLEEPANLFRNRFIAVGGKLFVTEERLIFNSHKYNFQNGETSILRSDIDEIVERKTMHLVDNGFRVVTKNHQYYDFVVNNRDEVVEKLKQ